PAIGASSSAATSSIATARKQGMCEASTSTRCATARSRRNFPTSRADRADERPCGRTHQLDRVLPRELRDVGQPDERFDADRGPYGAREPVLLFLRSGQRLERFEEPA